MTPHKINIRKHRIGFGVAPVIRELSDEHNILIGKIIIKWNSIEVAIDLAFSYSIDIYYDIWNAVAASVNGIETKIEITKLAVLRRMGVVGFDRLCNESFDYIKKCSDYRGRLAHSRVASNEREPEFGEVRKTGGVIKHVNLDLMDLQKFHDHFCAAHAEASKIVEIVRMTNFHYHAVARGDAKALEILRDIDKMDDELQNRQRERRLLGGFPL